MSPVIQFFSEILSATIAPLVSSHTYQNFGSSFLYGIGVSVTWAGLLITVMGIRKYVTLSNNEQTIQTTKSLAIKKSIIIIATGFIMIALGFAFTHWTL